MFIATQYQHTHHATVAYGLRHYPNPNPKQRALLHETRKLRGNLKSSSIRPYLALATAQALLSLLHLLSRTTSCLRSTLRLQRFFFLILLGVCLVCSAADDISEARGRHVPRYCAKCGSCVRSLLLEVSVKVSVSDVPANNKVGSFA